jgi:hypothetical protein
MPHPTEQSLWPQRSNGAANGRQHGPIQARAKKTGSQAHEELRSILTERARSLRRGNDPDALIILCGNQGLLDTSEEQELESH